MILIIDNYDSFTYNLVQLVGLHTNDVKVIRNDALSIEEIEGLKPERILISPGPGRPEQAGVCVELIRALGPSTPILGVCLGHQAIGAAYGGTIGRAPRLMHGKTSQIRHDGSGIYSGLANPFTATRYHSLIIAGDHVPPELDVTSTTEDRIVMGVRHKKYPVEGIQFHPESVLTASGPQIIANWLKSPAETPVGAR
jgi:anthranilate synthase component II